MLGDGSDIFRRPAGRGRRVLAAEWGGRVEELAAEVLELAGAVAGGGQAAPAAGGPVQDGPDEVEAAGLPREPADDLDAAAGFAEGALDEVGVPDPLVMLGGEPQVAGQLLAVRQQAADRGRVELAVFLGECFDAGLHRGDEPLPGFHPGGGEGGGVEDLPVGAADLLLRLRGDFRQEVAASVDEAALAQRAG